MLSTLLVTGLVAGHRTNMLVDTGSGVTIVREDVWKESGQEERGPLSPPFRPGAGFAWSKSGGSERWRAVWKTLSTCGKRFDARMLAGC